MKEFIIEMENGGVMEGELYEDIAPEDGGELRVPD